MKIIVVKKENISNMLDDLGLRNFLYQNEEFLDILKEKDIVFVEEDMELVKKINSINNMINIISDC
ncbi:MAG: hypothetical protein Q4C49_07740 [Bacillota bacterium]|nr:hypothetical protein [Bacillota bacterium]